MELKTLNDLFVHQLKDLYGAEQQLLKAMPKMLAKITAKELQQAFTKHMEETQNQVKRLEQVFQSLGIKPEAEKCKAMEGLLKEAEEFLGYDADKAVMDKQVAEITEGEELTEKQKRFAKWASKEAVPPQPKTSSSGCATTINTLTLDAMFTFAFPPDFFESA